MTTFITLFNTEKMTEEAGQNTWTGVRLGVRGPVEGVRAGVGGALPSPLALLALLLFKEEVLLPPDTERSNQGLTLQPAIPSLIRSQQISRQ